MTDLVGRYGCISLPGILPRAISAATGHWANHCFLMLPDGMIAESWVPYVHVRPLSDFAGCRIEYNVDDPMSTGQRKSVVAYALARVKDHTGYDYMHFAGLGLLHLLHLDVLPYVPLSGRTAICSRLVAQAGRAAGLDWSDGLPAHRITPATLARRIDDAQNHREHARLWRTAGTAPDALPT